MRAALRVLGGAAAVGAVALVAWLLLRPPGGMVVRAYFSDASGLVPGNDVRINGAVAGTVTQMRLAANDQALVTMRLYPDIPYAPRADATAAIRPVDLLGDNYVALTLGSGPRLRGPIPASHTLDAPQLAALLSVFHPAQRQALGALLVGMGETLDDRGADLNQAALELRPTLAAADGVMQELGSQNADLRQVISGADRITSQAAARNVALGRSVGALHDLVALTSRHLLGLGAGLQTLPMTLQELGGTAGQLQATAVGARPLAVTLRQLAPTLAATARRLPSFLDTLHSASDSLAPALSGATSLLVRGDPSLYALGSGLRELAAAGPTIGGFAGDLVAAAPDIVQGFFVNFPDEATEPGNQPLDPFANPLRHYWRGAAVISCESFGLPIEPGCLAKFLSANSGEAAAARRAAGIASPGAQRATPGARPGGPGLPLPARGGSRAQGAGGASATRRSGSSASASGGSASSAASGSGSLTSPAAPSPAPSPSNGLQRLLGYLLH